MQPDTWINASNLWEGQNRDLRRKQPGFLRVGHDAFMGLIQLVGHGIWGGLVDVNPTS